MSGEACPMPTPPQPSEATIIPKLLAAHRIAIVGLSDNPARVSNHIANYLVSHGKEIIPINPGCKSVLGQECYASLKDVPGEIDLVNVFRRPEFCADIVREAIAVGAKGVWLQSGIKSSEAESIAREAGIAYIQNRCIMVEHSRHP